MSVVDLRNADGVKAGTVTLPDELFDQTANIPLIHQVVTAQLAAARQGTHATKTRGEVRGGGKKPWRQKGTGRARQGSRRAPQWVGGGIVHGPQPRSYKQKTPKQMVQAALLGVLSDRARDERIFVVDTLVAGDAPSTKVAAATLATLGTYRTVLVVLDRDDFVGWLSVRNLPQAHAIAADQLNAYDVITADAVLFTQTAVESFAAAKGCAVQVKVTKTKAAPKAKAADKAEAASVDDADEKPAAKKPAAKAVKAEEVAVAEPVDADEKPAPKKRAAKAVKAEEAAVAEPVDADEKPAPKKRTTKAVKADEAPADASEETK